MKGGGGAGQTGQREKQGSGDAHVVFVVVKLVRYAGIHDGKSILQGRKTHLVDTVGR